MTAVALNDVTIELSVPSFEITKAFYSKLEFQVVWEEPAKRMNGYLEMKRDKIRSATSCALTSPGMYSNICH